MTESRIQQDIVRYYLNTYCLAHFYPRSLIMSVPNELKPRLTQTGLYAGCADLIVFHIHVTRVWILFIEVKTPAGVISDKQKNFKSHIDSMGEYINNNNIYLHYYVVRSLNEFKNIIDGFNKR